MHSDHIARLSRGPAAAYRRGGSMNFRRGMFCTATAFATDVLASFRCWIRPVPDLGCVKWLKHRLKHRLVTMAECTARRVVSGRRFASMSMSLMIWWLLSAPHCLPGAIPERQGEAMVGVVAVAVTATVVRTRVSMSKSVAKNPLCRDGQSVARKPM